MRRLIQCCSVFLCCLLLLPVFSVSVNAEELEIKEYYLSEYAYYVFGNAYTRIDGDVWTYNVGNGQEEKTQHSIYIASNKYSADNHKILHYYNLGYVDKTVIAYGGIKTTVKLESIYYSNLITDGNGKMAYDTNPIDSGVTVTYVDGTKENFSSTFSGKTGEKQKNIQLDFTPKKDVVYFEFYLLSKINDEFTNNSLVDTKQFTLTSYFGEWLGDGTPSIKVIQPSEEATLLGGIWDTLTGGFSALTSGITNVFNKLGDVVNAITSLPQKIWEFIENGLKRLFIPSDFFVDEWFTNMGHMFDSKLGAISQVGDILYGMFDNITATADTERGWVELPEVTIPLPDGQSFTFGGYTVNIVPERFEFLAEACSFAIGLISTLWFINGLRKRYDAFLGG